MNEDLSKLDLLGLLERLAPIPEPQAVSLLPQTAGWLWAALLLFAIGLWLARRRVLRRRADAYRRAALEEIEAAGADPVILARILRRTALAAYPREQVAGLHGERWLAFLDAAVGGSRFREGAGRVLVSAPYTGIADVDPEADLAALAADWVRRHRAHEAASP